ncbi:Uncharacterised protein [Raoultella planticola]|nr:Uncharacterised protein [Raoultella planticola]
MENHADILQQRIEVATIDRIERQRAGKRIRGEQNKQQKAEGDGPHHRQHPRYGVLRHPPTEQRHRESPDAQQQHPQQQ